MSEEGRELRTCCCILGYVVAAHHNTHPVLVVFLCHFFHQRLDGPVFGIELPATDAKEDQRQSL
mgnify:CR=1 FL=1